MIHEIVININNQNTAVSSILEKKNLKIEMQVYDSAPLLYKKGTIVLIHGNSFSQKIFKDQIKYFSTRYRVIALDLLGHGKSTKINNCENLTIEEKNTLAQALYNPQTMISSVTQVLQALQVTRAHIIGWSLGGHFAYGVAVEDPGLVSTITSIGSPPVNFSEAGITIGFSDWFINILIPEWIHEPKPYSAKKAAEICGNIGLKPEDTDSIADMMTTDPLVRKYLFEKIKEYENPIYVKTSIDGENFVKCTNIPICLIVGKNDAGINIEYISKFDTQLRNNLSRVHIIEDAPHAVFITHKKSYYNIVDHFIDSAP